ncbi:hypothetical protein [Cellulosilyticum ruminicola]|uniref:hypothetical protein n=1 Tax=Cellulosilyticum ruminicola TaxID=425254 RepID=UPI0006D0C01E|nr:hypothetical protein [Cellulosilyticum ruminicola]
MKRKLTQSIAGLLLVCMAGTTIFGAVATTRQGTPSTNTPNKAPTVPTAPEKTPATPVPPVLNSPTTPAPSKPMTPVVPSKPAKPTTAPTPVKPTEPPTTQTKPVKPTEPPTTQTKPAKPQQSTCPGKPNACPNKPKPFALDNFKVIQATLAGCGVDEQELAAYIKQGKKLEDVLKEEKISTRKFKKRVLKEYCKVIDQAVKDGQLTNEQGAQLKEAIKETVKNWLPKNNIYTIKYYKVHNIEKRTKESYEY